MDETTNIRKIIEIDKYYLIHDGSKTGHPGVIIWKDDECNLYLAVKIGTSRNNNNKLLLESVSNDQVAHYVYNKPFLGKRKDFGSKVFLDLVVTDELRSMFGSYLTTNPTESKSINRKDRRNFKRLMKAK